MLPLPGLTPGERACGLAAPRIVFDQGRFWVGYSVCGHAAGTMASAGADIRGPWRDYKLMAEAHGTETDRSDAMIFNDKDQWIRSDPPFPCTFLEDDDGTLLVNPPAWLGRAMKGETLETVDFQKMTKHKFHHERNLDMEEDCEVGVRKIGGRYMTWSADWNGNYDMQYRTSDTIEGPWRNLRIGVPHGGNGELFRRADGSWWFAGFYNCNDFATRCGDPNVFTRLFILPLHIGWHGDELIIEPVAVRKSRARLEQLGALWQVSRGDP